MRFKRYIFSIALISLIASRSAHAAAPRIFFGLPPGPYPAGTEFEAMILVDSDQPINAYVASFSYDPAALRLEGFSMASSVVDIFQSLPRVSESGSVTFKGGGTAPFKGAGGRLFSARFQAIRPGDTFLHIDDASFYLANGKGTRVVPQYQDAAFKISSSTAGQGLVSPNVDAPPPSISRLSFVNDPLNPSQKLLSYSVQDGGAGIRSISYQARTFLLASPPMPAINPVALSKNAWSASLMVVDAEGRSVEKTIYDWSALEMPALIFFAIALLLISAQWVRKKMYNE